VFVKGIGSNRDDHDQQRSYSGAKLRRRTDGGASFFFHGVLLKTNEGPAAASLIPLEINSYVIAAGVE